MRKVNKNLKNKRGVITIEACITGMAFLLIMLFLCGFFVVYLAQSKVYDTALKTVQSLSVEAYYINKLHIGFDGEMGASGAAQSGLGFLLSKLFDGIDTDKKEYFSHSQEFIDVNMWWKDSALDSVGDVAKKRFIGYLAGGDEKKADGILEGMRVVDGIDGLDFSDSYVSDNVLYIVIKYKIEFPFDIAKIGIRSTSETVCAKLWLDGA